MNLNYQILRIRRVEEAIANRYPELRMRCPIHLDCGSEWVSVAICSQLQLHDAVFGGHRSHSQYLACGGDLKALIAELYGKSTGCCGGRGGSMHLQSDGIFKASTSIVGGTIPLAVGAAWAKKLKNEPGVVVCFFGDGAFEEGVTHESFIFSVLHRLPIIFICSNNGLAVTTPIEQRQGNRGMGAIAKAHGLDVQSHDNDPVSLSQIMRCSAIGWAKTGIPQFIEVKTERQRQHCGMDHEFELKNDFVKQGTAEEELAIQQEIEEAFKFVEESPKPTNPHEGVFYAE